MTTLTLESKTMQELMTNCDVKANSEVRTAFGGAIGTDQLLMKLLLDGATMTKHITMVVVPKLKSIITFKVLSGKVELTFSVTITGEGKEHSPRFGVDTLELTTVRTPSGNFKMSEDLVVLEMGIFDRLESDAEGLFQCESNSLKRYNPNGTFAPIKHVPVHLFI